MGYFFYLNLEIYFSSIMQLSKSFSSFSFLGSLQIVVGCYEEISGNKTLFLVRLLLMKNVYIICLYNYGVKIEDIRKE